MAYVRDFCQEVTQVDMGEHFCLKWNNHQENLTGIMAKLLDEQKFIDVSIVCEMKTFKAHQTVLSACSPYFQQVLEENPHPHPIVILRDVKECEMSALLQYMYRGEVNVRDHELSAFLNTARALQVRGLSDNKRENTMINKTEPTQESSPSPQNVSPVPQNHKRIRLSTTIPENQLKRPSSDCEKSPSPLPIICKPNATSKSSSSVSTSSFSDNMSDVHFADTLAPSAPPAIKQEVDGTSAQSDEQYHGLAHHLNCNDGLQRRSREGGNGGGGGGAGAGVGSSFTEQKEWSVEYSNDNRSYHSQKVELPKVPLPQTQSFSSQLQAPPIPELYPCYTKYKVRREFTRPKEQPGPSFNLQNQTVSVIRNADTAEVSTQRKSGRFRPGWMENFSWLQYDEGVNTMFCKTCRKWSSAVPDIRTSFVEGNANFRLEIVNHHDKSKAHRMCMAKEEESIPRLEPLVCDAVPRDVLSARLKFD